VTDVENVVVPRGAALVLHHRDPNVTAEQLEEARARILDALGPGTRVLLIGDPDGMVDVHVLDDGARDLVDAALALHHPEDSGLECAHCTSWIPAGPVVRWPCPTALALGVEA
jgi:hypothetical protein